MKPLLFFLVFLTNHKLQVIKSQHYEYDQSDHLPQRQQESFPSENNYPYSNSWNPRNFINVSSIPNKVDEKIRNLQYPRYPNGQANAQPPSGIDGYHDQGLYHPQDDVGPSPSGGIDMDGSNRYITPSSSRSISGDYCWDPLFTCDTANTILYCLGGRCTCPSGQWTMAPGNIPLNTVWHSGVRRCVSLIGSGCHVSVNNGAKGLGYVYCQPGIRCVRHPTYPEVGTCGASTQRQSIIVIISIIFGLLLNSLY